MPADFTGTGTGFVPSPTFSWSAPVQAATQRNSAKRTSAKHKSAPRKRRRKPLSAHQRAILTDRLETAMRRGTLPRDAVAPLLQPLMRALFPEDFAEPRRRPKAPVDSAPGSPDRVADYEARQARGESLYHEGDADPDDRRALLGKMLANGVGQVVGWISREHEQREHEADGADADEWEHACAA